MSKFRLFGGALTIFVYGAIGAVLAIKPDAYIAGFWVLFVLGFAQKGE
jgi:hypothetical protein